MYLNQVLPSALVLILLQVGGICRAEGEIGIRTRYMEYQMEWARSMMQTMEAELVAMNKSLQLEQLGPDGTIIKERFESEVRAAWGDQIPAMNFEHLVRDVQLFVGHTSVFNEMFGTDFTYRSKCVPYERISMQFFLFRALQGLHAELVKTTISEILKSALDACLRNVILVKGVHVCNRQTWYQFSDKFQQFLFRQFARNNDLRNYIEKESTNVKYKCNQLLNTNDIDKIIPALALSYLTVINEPIDEAFLKTMLLST